MSGHVRWSEVKAEQASLVLRGLIDREALWRERVGDEDYMRAVRYWHAAAGHLSFTVLLEPNIIGSCWVCGAPARYADLDFEAPVCGGICVWAAWEALRLHDTRWRAW